MREVKSKILHSFEGPVQTLGPIRRQKTLTEQAADAIRTRIVDGQFEFGDALSEIALATELGVSKTPVREAFLQLKNEGLVDILPQRGTFVFRMSLDELRQLWEMREVLETNSLAFAMRKSGDNLIRLITPIIDGMAKAAEDREPIIYRRLDAEFHAAIITASDNSFIQSAYNIIALRVQAFRSRLSLDAQNWRQRDEHLSVAELIHKRDEAAVEVLRKHIRGAFEDYVKRVSAETANVA
jgi:DNA-binding GntR family transcriptional regulator